MGVFSFIGVLSLSPHLVADVAYAFLDPRIRYALRQSSGGMNETTIHVPVENKRTLWRIRLRLAWRSLKGVGYLQGKPDRPGGHRHDRLLRTDGCSTPHPDENCVGTCYDPLIGYDREIIVHPSPPTWIPNANRNHFDGTAVVIPPHPGHRSPGPRRAQPIDVQHAIGVCAGHYGCAGHRRRRDDAGRGHRLLRRREI